MNNASLHAAIITFFLKHQRPPAVSEIATQFRCDEAQARSGLKALAKYHGAVLHPNSGEIWVAHPFSAAPTTCVVRSGSRAWWGNCAWCSLGLAQLAGGTATIETRMGALDDFATIRIEDGKLLDTDYVVHFPIPMRNAWDNVIYTCSIMLCSATKRRWTPGARRGAFPKATFAPSRKSGILRPSSTRATRIPTGRNGRPGRPSKYSSVTG